MARANKELAYYQEKAELAKQLNHMDERRAKKMSKLEEDEAEASEAEEAEVVADGEENADAVKGKRKRMKNLKKMMDYHGRKRREFRQREPIPVDGMQAREAPSKRQRTE